MLNRNFLRCSMMTLLCFGMQEQVLAEILKVRLPLVTRQPAIHKKIDYHIYTDYNSRGLSNWRHITPHNLISYGD